ncbi:MAG TPA: PP2C family protein-serine/threonine phosphatase [Hymenobacter sp.]|uniref:PP2C family protein-serine/threonine phosphatase n=1 Tax=Hymenobacter sp. TaxID=1898978 RepID=UPI002D7F4E74|nr:PP2C family protein-serine/threonine phosphatase [Hymenobacter sp.]HET9505808.1 PP2C family protein-serine/threonine phosphatase [Hymenobacter sp.]
MPKIRLSAWFLVAAGACWLVLLLSTLSQGQPLPGLPANWPRWLLLLAQGGFAAFVFIYARVQPEPLAGQNFIGLLRRLFLRGLGLTAGLGVLVSIEQLASHHTLPLPGDTTRAVVYTVALALFMIMLAQTLYTWRSLVNFRGGSKLRREWTVFEILLGLVLLLQLFTWKIPDGVRLGCGIALGLFGIYLSGHQRWIAYLSLKEKWQAILIQLGILGFTVCFLLYLRGAQADPVLLVPATQSSFLAFNSFFATFYALAGLLITLFNLPVAKVFEERRAEIMSLQQLSQIIQRGQSAPEIYQILFSSAIQTGKADAAALLPATSGEGRTMLAAPLQHQLSLAELATLGTLLMPPGTSRAPEVLEGDLRRSSQYGPALPEYSSLVVLPMHNKLHDYGTLVLLSKEPYNFDSEVLSILHAFTAQTVLSFENLQLAQEALVNQRTQDELRIAALVQERLIPRQLPTDDWFEVATYAQAAKEVGGDFYDFLHLPGQKLAVLIGDVSGKGVTAAFHTAQMKGIFHALMQANPLAKKERERYPDPHRFMVQANEALTHCLERSSFITAAFYLIDYQAGGFSFARAGHCHTLYYHSIQEEVSYFRTEGLGLGIIRNAGYEKHVKTQFWDYNPGDVMVIYTDGIVEARDGDGNEYGEDRLREMLERCFYQTAEEINAELRHDVQEFSRGQPLHDDQTLLVIKFKAAQPHA